MAKTESLDNAKAFFEQIVKPSVDDFMNTPSQFRTAFSAATALFHMHEWLYEFNQAQLEQKYSQTFATKGALWAHVESLVPTSGFIRDLANASKHVRLTLRPSTSMTHIANTVIQSLGYGEGAYGAGRYGGRNVKMKDCATEVSLDDCVQHLMALWEPLSVGSSAHRGAYGGYDAGVCCRQDGLQRPGRARPASRSLCRYRSLCHSSPMISDRLNAIAGRAAPPRSDPHHRQAAQGS